MYNSDDYLSAQYDNYQKELCDMDYKKNDDICTCCGAWIDKETYCKPCDIEADNEYEKSLNERNN
jgi:predicted amidophosphoribosyltransferase